MAESNTLLSYKERIRQLAKEVRWIRIISIPSSVFSAKGGSDIFSSGRRGSYKYRSLFALTFSADSL